ncbi:hypothetical protein MROS_0898 [Melioribacter roseus P3M-2]|uniref:Cupin type-2 domain-containing protein n=2 Tax=Melioribacteraceae TaxID=1334117 RepID=I6ZPZ5_MELRP|nr:hypothetical protein MROS_0898 [Melioribacter roseus P3M-2]
MLKKNINSIKRITVLNLFGKGLIYTTILIACYLIVGYILHLAIFPEDKPEVSSYFKPGHVFESQAEGFRQTVARQENGLVYCYLEIKPYAPGPPKHIHTNFDETFEIENGELSIWIDGKIKKIKPGETVRIPKGTPHKPFNETSDTIRVKGAFPFPEGFAFGLVQIYGLMDDDPDFGKFPHTMLMVAPLYQSDFDSYLAEGPPVFIQKLTSFILTPIARLMGYKSYYKKYDISMKGNDKAIYLQKNK